MANIVIMPRQGQSVESCIVTSFAKNLGDMVNIGDILFSYETDKSTFDEIATVAGKILKVFCEEGDDIACLEPVLIIGEDGENIDSLVSAKNSGATEVIVKDTPKIEIPLIKQDAIVSATGEVKISPRAKEYAAKSKANLANAVGTGPNGRIIERDITKLLERGLRLDSDTSISAAPVYLPEAINFAEIADVTDTVEAVVAENNAYSDIKLTNVRKTIAKAMTSSLSTMAQLTLNASFDATNILNYRARLKSNAESLGIGNITLNDIVLYATAKTLLKHKDLNSNYFDDYIRYFTNVNLGVAVDTDRGLLVPVLFGADKLSLNDLSKKTKELVAQVQKGTVSPDALKGGTFTVTNLGSLGVESFTPVINPPQTGILGVNNITKRVKDVNGQIVMYDCMTLSLTFDHRALDGAPAARFLKDLCESLENFDVLLSK